MMNKIVKLKENLIDLKSKKYKIDFLDKDNQIVRSHEMVEITLEELKVILRRKEKPLLTRYIFRSINLKNTISLLKLDYRITFVNCLFIDCEFNEICSHDSKIIISNSSFYDVRFVEHKFNQSFNINNSIFFTDLVLDRCEINNQVYFEYNDFLGDVLLTGLEGEEPLVMIENEFHHQFKAWVCNNKTLSLSYSTFHEPIKMLVDESDIEMLILKGCTFSSSLHLYTTDFKSIDISDAYIDGKLHLENLDLGLDSLNFSNVSTSGEINLDWLCFSQKCGLEKQEYKNAINMIALLSKDYSDTGQYEYQDLAYLKLRRLKNKKEWKDVGGRNIILRPFNYLYYILRYILYDAVGRYGTSYNSVFITMFITIFGFAGLYRFVGLDITKLDFISVNSGEVDKYFGCFYYSAITFFTVGYGEITPNSNIVAILAILESFLGVFLMAYFVVAFARKLVR